MGGAIAIFVKTPGLSRVKTRLALGIGSEAATDFYLASTSTVTAVAVLTASRIDAELYFAVAEVQGMESPLWEKCERVYQGEGELGNRLDTVYRQLLRGHNYVLLLGADAPQLEPSVLQDAAKWLKNTLERRFAIGPAADGGFWLFGGNCDVPLSVWTNTPYSHSETGSLLHAQLLHAGLVLKLPELRDVDQAEDLEVLQKALSSLDRPLREQVELIEIIDRLLH